jgi:hypothetical protein
MDLFSEDSLTKAFILAKTDTSDDYDKNSQIAIADCERVNFLSAFLIASPLSPFLGRHRKDRSISCSYSHLIHVNTAS